MQENVEAGIFPNIVSSTDTSPTRQASTKPILPCAGLLHNWEEMQTEPLCLMPPHNVAFTQKLATASPSLWSQPWFLCSSERGHVPHAEEEAQAVPPPLQRLEHHLICCRELCSPRTWLMFRVPPSAQTEPAWEQSNSYHLG